MFDIIGKRYLYFAISLIVVTGILTLFTPHTTSALTINEDGTYSDTAADGTVIAEGTWAVTDGKTCFTPNTEGEEAMCYTETAPGADGSFTATPDSGDPVTVRPATAAAAE